MSDTITAPEETKTPAADDIAEGFQFLQNQDLDSELEEITPSEETDEEPPEKDTAGTPEEEVEAEPEETAPDKDTAEEPREIKSIKVGDKVYPDVETLAAAYQTSEQLIGRQGQHIGDLNRRITELEGKIPRSDGTDDPEPEYDALDKEAVDNWNAWNTRRIKREIAAEQEKADKDRQEKEAVEAAVAAQAETQAFLESHPDLSVKQLLEVTRLRGEKGIPYDDALSQVVNPKEKPKKPPEKPIEEPDKETRTKQEAADKTSKNLSEGGGAAKAEVDLDSLTPAQWGEMKKNMTEAEIEAHLAGDDLG